MCVCVCVCVCQSMVYEKKKYRTASRQVKSSPRRSSLEAAIGHERGKDNDGSQSGSPVLFPQWLVVTAVAGKKKGGFAVVFPRWAQHTHTHTCRAAAVASAYHNGPTPSSAHRGSLFLRVSPKRIVAQRVIPVM